MIANVLIAAAIALALAAALGPIAELTPERRGQLAIASIVASSLSIIVRVF